MEAVVPRHGVPSYVKTKKGRQIQADLIGVGLGISLNTALLAQTPVQSAKGALANKNPKPNGQGGKPAGKWRQFLNPTLAKPHTLATWPIALAPGPTQGPKRPG